MRLLGSCTKYITGHGTPAVRTFSVIYGYFGTLLKGVADDVLIPKGVIIKYNFVNVIPIGDIDVTLYISAVNYTWHYVLHEKSPIIDCVCRKESH